MLSSRILYTVFLVLFIFIAPLSSASANDGVGKILYGEIHGSISPAQVDLMDQLISKAETDEYSILLVRLDTPGGLGKSMRSIVKSIFASEVPVCFWIGPTGAHAASAGTFLAAAGVVSGMAPGTNMGAAIPVTGDGEDLKGSMKTKVQNDFASFIKSIAVKRGRNYQWYEQAVKKGLSLGADEALKMNVVDLVADSPEAFISRIGEKGILINDRVEHFDGSNVEIDKFNTDLRYRILSWLLDPQVSYFLLMGGIIGLFFELSHPGAILPGVIGGFCLLTSFYAMSILPTNAAGLLLLILGGVLFILELYIVSHGLLTISAIICLFVGSLILFDGGSTFKVPLSSVLATVSVFSLFAGLVIYLVTKSQISRPVSGNDTMIGQEGIIRSISSGKIKILVRGEIWNAENIGDYSLAEGDKVMITDVSGLKLFVSKK